MGTICFRLVGRFVFAERDGTLNVIAVNTSFARRNEPHTVVMTAPFENVDLLSSLAPDVVVMSPFSTGSALLASQEAVWHLAGCTLEIAGDNYFRWRDQSAVNRDIISFATLTQGTDGKPTISESCLSNPGPASPAAALISFQTGEGSPGPTSDLSFVLTRDVFNPKPPQVIDQKFAESVEVFVTSASDGFVTVAVTAAGESSSRAVAISAAEQKAQPPVVTLSNLCSRPSLDVYDLEFSAMYDVLVTPPSLRERRIPVKLSAIPWRESVAEFAGFRPPDSPGPTPTGMGRQVDCHTAVLGSF